MTRRICVALACVAVFGIALSICTPPIRSHEKDEKVLINVEEIGRKVILIGRLGVPLGETVKLHGTWSSPAIEGKDDSLKFTIDRINDRKLADPVDFNISQMSARSKDLYFPKLNQYGLPPNDPRWTHHCPPRWGYVAA